MKKILNEQLDITPSNPLRIRYYDYKNYTFPWHYHCQYELIYVEEGEGYCVVGDNILNYTHESLFLFGPNLPHWMQNNEEYYQEDCPLRVKGVNVQFEKDLMQYSFSNYLQFSSLRELLSLSSRGIHFDLRKHPQVSALMKKIPGSKGVDQFVLLLQVFSELSKIKEMVIGASPNYEETLGNFKVGKLDKIIAYLSRYYTREITLEEISSFAAMNPSSFCRFFKGNTGKTFKEYIVEMRVGYACNLLAVSQLSISQICYQSGFDSVSHFNRCFRKMKGCSPSEYKDMIFKERDIKARLR